MIQRYGDLNEQAKQIKKEMEPLNASIKSIMVTRLAGQDKVRVDAGNYTAEMVIQRRRSMDQEKLVAKLKMLGFTQAIRTVEVPDEKVIEDLIYNGQLPAAELADCIREQEVQVLTVKPVKAKKGV